MLGNTYGMLVLQDFEALTPNLLARTVETVEGGGIVVLLLSSLDSLTQLYSLTMDVHARLRTESHQEVKGRRACCQMIWGSMAGPGHGAWKPGLRAGWRSAGWRPGLLAWGPDAGSTIHSPRLSHHPPSSTSACRPVQRTPGAEPSLQPQLHHDGR